MFLCVPPMDNDVITNVEDPFDFEVLCQLLSDGLLEYLSGRPRTIAQPLVSV